MSTFWDPDDLGGIRLTFSESDPDGVEIKKQAGFHVDRFGELITSPLDIPEGVITLFITLMARGVEMHLAEDRTRQQAACPGDPWIRPKIFTPRSSRSPGQTTSSH
jgi:hypothetical protein